MKIFEVFEFEKLDFTSGPVSSILLSWEFFSISGFWPTVLSFLVSSPRGEFSDIYLIWKISVTTLLWRINHQYQYYYPLRVSDDSCYVGTGNTEIWALALRGLTLVEIISSTVEMSKSHTEIVTFTFAQEKLLSISCVPGGFYKLEIERWKKAYFLSSKHLQYTWEDRLITKVTKMLI